MSNLESFIEAINNKKIVRVRVNTFEKGIIERLCVPFDYGPSRKYRDGSDRYHFYDLDSPEGKHNLSVLPDQVLSLEITKDEFDPGEYVKWTPNWHIKRDWGRYS